MSRAVVAVLQFPGINCEDETCRALDFAGVQAELVRWNESARRLARFAGFVIPGGFSYQDRVRAGSIAAKSDLMEALTRQAQEGKPVLGICNGAQILVEAGLVPGDEPGRVDLALARNRIEGWEGYHARWVFVRAEDPDRCFFTRGLREPLPMVVAHAEGRFVSRDPELLRRWESAGERALVYCDEAGRPAESWPANPNGSPHALAGLAGLQGQVLAMMPHPERATWLWQVPEDLPGAWGERRRAAVGDRGLARRGGPGLAILSAFDRLTKGGAA